MRKKPKKPKLAKPILFLLEDSQELAAQVECLAKRLGWRVLAARSLKQAKEEARKACRNGAPAITAAMLDLMIPAPEQDLIEINDLLAKRGIEGEKLTKRGPKNETSLLEKRVANARMDKIDEQIMKRILDDGGIEFLRSNEGKTLLARGCVALAIFTARRIDSVPKRGDETIGAAVREALGREPDAWFDKPVSPLDLEQWLEEVKEQGANGVEE